MQTPFELRSLPSSRGKSRLFMIQLPVRTTHVESVDVPLTVAKLDGSALETAWPAILDMLADAGLPRHELSVDDEHTFAIEEALAARLSLVFNAVDSLRSDAKIRGIAQSVSELDMDEVVFWLGKIVGDADNAETHRKALIMILADG